MRREKDRLLGEILRCLADEPAAPTRSVLARRVHVPYDRLKEYLVELAAHDLITGDAPPRLTERGRSFVRGYEAYLETLARAGIDPAPDHP